MATNFRHTAEELRREVEAVLQRVGILCRVFARGKESDSLNKKLRRDPSKYGIGKKLIQDAIGVRVVLYFAEDVEIVAALLSAEYEEDPRSSTVDLPDTDQFAVTRHNLIFKVPEHLKQDMERAINDFPVDITFEVQLRSILSEGWHEVEHDLRYKSRENWNGHDDLSRALNGIIATIETSEWTMRKIFDDLAYRNYKLRKWPQMLHNRMRLRASPELSSDLCAAMSSDAQLAKHVFRMNRRDVIFFLNGLRPTLPLTLDNVVYVWNHMKGISAQISDLTPQFVQDTLNSFSAGTSQTTGISDWKSLD